MTSIVELLAASRPDAVRLAEVVSLAARVEPFLLRRARLDLLPDLDASAEADLWFSPLVESRGPGGIVLVADACDELRRRLARDPALLVGARDLVQKAHAASPTIRVEEDVIWHSLTEGGVDAAAIERELQRVVATMRRDETRAPHLARWALRAAPRLPAMAQGLESARMLSVAARVRLEPAAVAPELEDAAAGGWLAGVLPESFGRAELGARLLERGVELSSPPAEGAHTIEVPGTNPLIVDVKGGGSARPARSVSVRRGETMVMRPAVIRVVASMTGQERTAIHTDHLPALLALSPGGRFLAAADPDGGLRVWSVESGEQRAELSTERPPAALAVSENGALVAVATGRNVRVSALDGMLVGKHERPDPVVALAFAEGGMLVLLTADGATVVWATLLQNRRPLSQRGNLGPASDVPDAAFLAVARGTRAIAVGNAEGHVLVREEGGSFVTRLTQAGGLAGIAFESASRSQRLVTLRRDGTVRRWDLGAGRPRPEGRGRKRPAVASAMSPDGALVALAAVPDRIELRTGFGDLYTLARPAPEAGPPLADPERELDALAESVAAGRFVVVLGAGLFADEEGLLAPVNRFLAALPALLAARALSPATVLTFNYDSTLDRALSQAGVDFETVIWEGIEGESLPGAEAVGRDVSLVVKVRGIAGLPGPVPPFLEERIRSAHLLFLGCSAPHPDDPTGELLDATGPDGRATALVSPARAADAAVWLEHGVAAVELPAVPFLSGLERRVLALPRHTGDDWALVVGIDRYEGSLPAIRGAVADARAFREWLVAADGGGVPVRQVSTLLAPGDGSAGPDREPTSQGIASAVAQLGERSRSTGGRLYFYFAGHGTRLPGDGRERDLLVAADSDPSQPSSAINLSALLESFMASGFDDVFVFVDASRVRGALSTSGRAEWPLPRRFEPDPPRTQQFVLQATSPGAGAADSGAFTDVLLRGLQGEGRAKAWSQTSGRYEVRWDRLVEYVNAELERRRRSVKGRPAPPLQMPEQSAIRGVAGRDPDPVLASFPQTAFAPERLRVRVLPASAATRAEVRVYDELGSVVADARTTDGGAEFELPPRSYLVRASAGGYGEARLTAPVELYEPVELEVELRRDRPPV